ncbi:MAG: PH domain-containing protein [Myxococcaceae bacterium]|nr:PH domain-containing protein [Myxococcaceae bacterium]
MDDATFQRLDREVRALQRPDPSLLTYYLLIAFLVLPALPIILLPLYFRYHTLHFRFDAEGVSLGYGILFRREMHLTYARMQDIHMSQNLLERWLGIGTVTIQTAGAGDGGDMKIEGLRHFEAVRDYLYARMRGVREKPALPLEARSTEERLLTEIRDAMRAAAAALEEGSR